MPLADSTILSVTAVLVAPKVSEAPPKRSSKAFRETLGPLLGDQFSGRWMQVQSGPRQEDALSPSPEPLLLLHSEDARMRLQVDERLVTVSLASPGVANTRSPESRDMPALGEAWDAFSQVCFLTANVLKEQCGTPLIRIGVVSKVRWQKPDNPVAFLQHLFFQPGATGDMPEELKIHFRHTIQLGKLAANRWLFLSAVPAKPEPYLELVLDVNTPADRTLDLNENQVRLFLANLRKHWIEVDGFLE